MADYSAEASQHETLQRRPETGAPVGEMTASPASAAMAVQRTLDGSPARYRPADILTLQRTVGNRAVQRVVAQALQRRAGGAVSTSVPIVQRLCPSCSAALNNDEEGGLCSECQANTSGGARGV
jgi:hypothetical protein